MAKQSKTPWIVCCDGTKGRDAYAIKCERCGYVQRFENPLPVNYYVATCKAFEKWHKSCKEPSDGRRPNSIDSPGVAASDAQDSRLG